MLILYCSNPGGSQEIEVIGPALDGTWPKLRLGVQKVLYARNQTLSAQVLEDLQFELFEATNGWRDQFVALISTVDMDTYVDLSSDSPSTGLGAFFYTDIAKAFELIVPTVKLRFIAARLGEDLPKGVAPPTLGRQYGAVEQALADASHLIRSGGGASSALDRAHTALHGYLLANCEGKTPTPLPTDGSFQAAFGFLQQHHPALKYDGTRGKEIGMVLSGCAKIIEASNTLRNKASMAHPNNDILPAPEAMLVINAMTSILHYLEMKFRG